MTEQATLSDIATSQGLILEAFETQHEILKQILAACQGDGTGELVTALRKLEAAVTANTQRLDGLPDAVAERETRHQPVSLGCAWHGGPCQFACSRDEQIQCLERSGESLLPYQDFLAWKEANREKVLKNVS